jgi:hypothetical protein
MRNAGCLAAMLLALVATRQCMAGEPVCGCESPREAFLQRIGPAGGWHPYGGGLLRWWDASCFPHCGGPDDYCRKSLPKLCWPGPYPSSYIWGPPESCCPPNKPLADCNKSH